MYHYLYLKFGRIAAWIITLLVYLVLLIGIFYFAGYDIDNFRYMNW